jgi:ABC-type ATPase involved in cell division
MVSIGLVVDMQPSFMQHQTARIKLNKSGTSVVIATHDIALMDEFDARRLVLHEGRLHVYE